MSRLFFTQGCERSVDLACYRKKNKTRRGLPNKHSLWAVAADARVPWATCPTGFYLRQRGPLAHRADPTGNNGHAILAWAKRWGEG